MGYICSIAEVDCPCKLMVEVDCPETSRGNPPGIPSSGPGEGGLPTSRKWYNNGGTMLSAHGLGERSVWQFRERPRGATVAGRCFLRRAGRRHHSASQGF